MHLENGLLSNKKMIKMMMTFCVFLSLIWICNCYSSHKEESKKTDVVDFSHLSPTLRERQIHIPDTTKATFSAQLPPRLLISIAMFEEHDYLDWYIPKLKSLLHPSTIVIIHLNALTNYNLSKLPRPEGFFYNSNRYKVRTFTGTISLVHLDNMWHITKYGSRDFSHVLLLSSNSILLRHGVEQHIFDTDASDKLVPQWKYAVKPFKINEDSREYNTFQMLVALIEPRLWEGVLGFYPIEWACHGYHEGSYMPYHVWMGLFDRMYQRGLLHLYHDANFQIENFMPQTYAYYQYRKPSSEFGGIPIVDFMWNDHDALNVTKYQQIKNGSIDGIFGVKIHGILLRDSKDSRIRDIITNALS
jgi:hypothetical protein